jgi:hypothetical protein
MLVAVLEGGGNSSIYRRGIFVEEHLRWFDEIVILTMGMECVRYWRSSIAVLRCFS